MSFRAGLYQLLSTAPTLVALQGARVFPIILPEGTQLPATTFQVVGGASQQQLNASIGLQRVRVQIDFRAADDATADALANATRTFLEQYTGVFPDGSHILNVVYLQPVDQFDSDTRQVRLTAEYYFYFNLPPA
jgi:hypothetical protein